MKYTYKILCMSLLLSVGGTFFATDKALKKEMPKKDVLVMEKKTVEVETPKKKVELSAITVEPKKVAAKNEKGYLEKFKEMVLGWFQMLEKKEAEKKVPGKKEEVEVEEIYIEEPKMEEKMEEPKEQELKQEEMKKEKEFKMMPEKKKEAKKEEVTVTTEEPKIEKPKVEEEPKTEEPKEA